jgi:hypothetical protein
MAIVSRLKSLGRMNTPKNAKPQDGRVSTSDPVTAERRRPRRYDKSARPNCSEVLDQLGFLPEDLRRWQHMTGSTERHHSGHHSMGSGKTTLYTTLKHATSEVNLCTIEDPIGMIEPAFSTSAEQYRPDLHGVGCAPDASRLQIIITSANCDLEPPEWLTKRRSLVRSTLHQRCPLALLKRRTKNAQPTTFLSR